MYNMQSGTKRKSFDVGPVPDGVPNGSSTKRNQRCVTGLASDALNRTLIASTLDGTVNVRSGTVSFTTSRLLTTYMFVHAVLRLPHRGAAMHCRVTLGSRVDIFAQGQWSSRCHMRRPGSSSLGY